jgi:hypothetical protein
MFNFNLYLVIFEKTIFVIASILYLIFAAVIVRQVSMMTRNVKDKFNGVLIAFSWIHLLFAIFLVLLTLLL